MPCFHPIKGYKSLYSNKITFDRRESAGIKMSVSCKQCSGCRQEYSRQWAMRNMHEASLWPTNIFITLTYDNEHLPEYNTLILSLIHI